MNNQTQPVTKTLNREDLHGIFRNFGIDPAVQEYIVNDTPRSQMRNIFMECWTYDKIETLHVSLNRHRGDEEVIGKCPSDYLIQKMYNDPYLNAHTYADRFKDLEAVVNEVYDYINKFEHDLDYNLKRIMNQNIDKVLELMFTDYKKTSPDEQDFLVTNMILSGGMAHSSIRQHLFLKFIELVRANLPEISWMTPEQFMNLYGPDPMLDSFIELVNS